MSLQLTTYNLVDSYSLLLIYFNCKYYNLPLNCQNNLNSSKVCCVTCRHSSVFCFFSPLKEEFHLVFFYLNLIFCKCYVFLLTLRNLEPVWDVQLLRARSILLVVRFNLPFLILILGRFGRNTHWRRSRTVKGKNVFNSSAAV